MKGGNMTLYEEPFGRMRPFGVGFDEMFKRLDAIHNQPNGNYPPYNIIKLSEDKFTIEIAAAGFDKKDISISLKDQSLKVSAKKPDEDAMGVKLEFVHKGIAGRSFERVFALAEHVKVNEACL